MLAKRKHGRANWYFQPSSILNYLGAVRRHLLPTASAIAFATVRAAELRSLYADLLDRLPPGSERNTLINALNSFQAYIVTERGDLTMPSKLFEKWRSQTQVGVGLVSSLDYERALKALPAYSNLETQILRIYLILGFRAGLRFFEVHGLTVDDFVLPEDPCARGVFEMTVRRNRHRDMKNETSRRILPLHLLLQESANASDSEMIEVRLWVDYRRREAMRTRNPRLFVNPVRPGEKLSYRKTEAKLDGLLANITQDRSVGFKTLRHSFASYLLATLLLPEDCSTTARPAALHDDAVSQHRQARVAAPLLGKGKLGQASLHAVSQLCGHAPVSTTLQNYAHMLDWSVACYVDRRSIQPGLSIEDAAGLTTMSHAALRKSVLRSELVAASAANARPLEDEHHRPVLPPRLRRGRGRAAAGAPPSIHLDTVLDSATRKIVGDAGRRGRGIVVWSERGVRRSHHGYKSTDQSGFARLDWRLIQSALEAERSANLEQFCCDNNLPVKAVIYWEREVELFRGSMLPNGMPRHLSANSGRLVLNVGWPRSPAQGADARLADRIWAEGAKIKGPAFRRALHIFRECYDGQRNEVLPKTLADARVLYRALARLGAIFGKEVTFRHYPGRGRKSLDADAVLAAMANTGLPRTRWRGRVGFRFARNADEGSGYGLRFGLTLLTVAFGGSVKDSFVIYSVGGYRSRDERTALKPGLLNVYDEGQDLMTRGENIADSEYFLDTNAACTSGWGRFGG